jgi:phytoene desaturase
MSIRRESREETYDVIVVGSGIGGLTAAALLAKAGKHVLVVERHDRPGGYAHGFQREKYTFDSAVHLLSGDGGITEGTLRLLGVRERCNFIRIDPFYTGIFPDSRFTAPLGVEEYIEAHVKLYPNQAKEFRQLMAVCRELPKEVRQVPTELSIWDFISMPKRAPKLFKYRNATLGQVIDEHLTDPRLKALYAIPWPYVGLPPSRLSFFVWCHMLMSYIEDGAYYCEGGFQNLANLYAASLRENGGELLLRTLVRKILVEDRRAAGVVLENGQRIRAPIVISNADARATFEDMVGSEHLPKRFVNKLRKMKPSLSGFVVYMATDLDVHQMDVAHEMFVFQSWDHDETYRGLVEGTPAVVGITIPTLADSSLAPPGEHLLTVITAIPYALATSWRDEKARYVDLLTEALHRVFPDFRNHITFAEGASPRTMERYTLNLTGAMYGWENSPEHIGLNRLDHRTPIRGLYLSGHWTRPGGGVGGVINSGVQTAQIVLGYRNLHELSQALQPAAV